MTANMLSATYLAVFEPYAHGYSVYFPDLPGCISSGDSLADAQRMATEAASLHIYGMELDGDPIPVPSDTLSPEDTEGNVIVPVTIHPDLFRLEIEKYQIY